MTPTQFKKLQETITSQIVLSVNGKIDKLNTKIDAYIVADNEWKEKVQPDIDSVANAKAWGKITLSIISIGALISGIILGILGYVQK